MQEIQSSVSIALYYAPLILAGWIGKEEVINMMDTPRDVSIDLIEGAIEHLPSNN